MYCYLISDAGLLPGRLTTQNCQQNSIGPPCTVAKFKLAVFTVPANALACALTCDPCQPTKFKGHPRVFMYVGVGYPIYHFHALKQKHLEQLAGALEYTDTLLEKEPH